MQALQGLQPGTAISAKGRERVNHIIRTAIDVLTEEGFNAFTMRHIAKRAGIYLRNLQYYFPTREELLQAISDEMGRRYGDMIDAALTSVSADPVARLNTVVNVYLQDNITNTAQRRYNVQVVALLYSLDHYSGKLLDKFYSRRFVTRFMRLLQDLNPGLDEVEADQRARMIGSLLDGILFFGGPEARDSKALELYCDSLRKQIHTIATRPARDSDNNNHWNHSDERQIQL